MLADGRDYMREYWWLATFPGTRHHGHHAVHQPVQQRPAGRAGPAAPPAVAEGEHGARRPLRAGPGRQRSAHGPAGRRDQDRAQRQVRAPDRGRRRGRRADPRAARALQHALLRGGHGPALARRRGARPRRPHDRADAGAGPPARDGHRGAALRAGRRRPVQLRGRHRRRRAVPRRLSEAPRAQPPRRELRAVLLPPARRRIPGLRHGVRPHRGLHLLRPALPGDRPHLRGQGRGDRLQSLGDGRAPVRAGVGARAAGARAGQRLLRRRPEPGGPRPAVR